MNSSDLLRQLEFNLIELLRDDKSVKIAVAMSGGIDSTALTFLIQQLSFKYQKSLVALIVNHKLRPTSSKEAQSVSELLNNRGIENVILEWNGEKPSANIEAIAREKRYELLINFCKQNNIKHLFLAHHLQDQAETFFIRLFRGSGIDGLASINSENKINGVNILRPLLKIPKEDLQNYLLEKNIPWVEDESNNDSKFLRNKIRKFLNSLEDKENILKRIDSAISEIAKAKVIIYNNIEKEEKDLVVFDKMGFIQINSVQFKNLNKDLALRELAKFLMMIGGKVYKPRFFKLLNAYNTICSCLEVNKKITFYGCIIRFIDSEKFVIYREISKLPEQIFLEFNEEILWDKRFSIKLIKNVKALSVVSSKQLSFNKLLKSIDKKSKLYNRLANIHGLEKEIFSTLPIILDSNNSIIAIFGYLESSFIEIKSLTV